MATYGVPLVIMGVSGSGKTTVAKLVGERLGYRFLDADDFHPPANIAKMKAGIALDDEDRKPWLAHLARVMAEASEGKEAVVLACSALKRAYRARLLADCPDLVFLYLAAEPRLLLGRLAAREGHYMPASLLASQLEALEAPGPDEAVKFGCSEPPDRIVERIAAYLGAS